MIEEGSLVIWVCCTRELCVVFIRELVATMVDSRTWYVSLGRSSEHCQGTVQLVRVVTGSAKENNHVFFFGGHKTRTRKKNP